MKIIYRDYIGLIEKTDSGWIVKTTHPVKFYAPSNSNLDIALEYWRSEVDYWSYKCQQ